MTNNSHFVCPPIIPSKDESAENRVEIKDTLVCCQTCNGLGRILKSKAATPAVGGNALIRVTASLAAAISLLERTPKAKMAAPSNKMFDQMLDDYRRSLEIGRAALMGDADLTHYEADAESVLAASPLRGRDSFEAFVRRAGFTDWSRYGDGYAKPLIDRMWSAWSESPPEQLTDNDLAEIMKLAGDHRVSSEALGIRLRALYNQETKRHAD